MNEEFLIKCIKDNYVDINNKNVIYFKNKLNDFASLINKSLGVNSFKFETVDAIIFNRFRGSIVLKDGETVVWGNDEQFNLEDVDFHLDQLFQIEELHYHNKYRLYFALGNYISIHYPDFASKITMLT